MTPYLLNIGNTHIQAAKAVPGASPELLATIETSSLRPSLSPKAILDLFGIGGSSQDWHATCACVVPRIQTLLQTIFPGKFRFITWKDYPQIDFSAYSVATLGADRIANAAAGYAFAKGAVVILDCGTAITSEIIDANGHFLGGLIMPGRAMARKAMAAHTAQLPPLPLDSNMPPLFGQNTPQAMRAGIDGIPLAGLRTHLISLKQVAQLKNCQILITGGDAPFFLNGLPETAPAPPLLTILGVQLALSNQIRN